MIYGTVYIGGIYEKTIETNAVSRYYHADGNRIAFRQGAGAVYSHMLTDHLGSSALTQFNTTAGIFQRTRYYPYGMIRSQQGSPVDTDKLFTGQQRETADGIYHYGARFYNADIGRFIQADSIVPGAGNPQALNRYAYVYNNPLKYSDPSGHKPMDMEGCYRNGKITCTNTTSSPVAKALEVVPMVSYGPEKILAGCKFCAFHNKWLRQRTLEAVETLHDAGWHLHMLPWGDRAQAATHVAGLYGREALDPWYDTPSPGEMIDYLLGGLAVAAVGSGGQSLNGGNIVPNTQIGSFWKQFEADFQSGKLQNYEVEAPSRQSSETATARRYANPPSVSSRGITITNLRTNQAVNVHVIWRLNVTQQYVPYIVPLHIHPSEK